MVRSAMADRAPRPRVQHERSEGVGSFPPVVTTVMVPPGLYVPGSLMNPVVAPLVLAMQRAVVHPYVVTATRMVIEIEAS